MQWAEGLRLGWGLGVCGLGDGVWVRRAAGEMVAGVAAEPRYAEWTAGGRAAVVEDAAGRRLVGARVTSLRSGGEVPGVGILVVG